MYVALSGAHHGDSTVVHRSSVLFTTSLQFEHSRKYPSHCIKSLDIRIDACLSVCLSASGASASLSLPPTHTTHTSSSISAMDLLTSATTSLLASFDLPQPPLNIPEWSSLNLVERAWATLLLNCTEFQLFTWVTFAMLIVVYVAASAPYWIIDTVKPRWARKYKIQVRRMTFGLGGLRCGVVFCVVFWGERISEGNVVGVRHACVLSLACLEVFCCVFWARFSVSFLVFLFGLWFSIDLCVLFFVLFC